MTTTTYLPKWFQKQTIFPKTQQQLTEINRLSTKFQASKTWIMAILASWMTTGDGRNRPVIWTKYPNCHRESRNKHIYHQWWPNRLKSEIKYILLITTCSYSRSWLKTSKVKVSSTGLLRPKLGWTRWNRLRIRSSTIGNSLIWKIDRNFNQNDCILQCWVFINKVTEFL